MIGMAAHVHNSQPLYPPHAGVDRPDPEKLRAGPSGLKIPWFLPYFDDETGETSTMRARYRPMLADPNIKAACLGKWLAVAASDLEVHPFNKKSTRSVEKSKFTQYVLTERIEGAVPKLVESICFGALVDGYSVSEKVWADEPGGRYKGKWVLDSLKSKNTGKDLVLEVDDFRNITGVMGLRYNSGQVFHPRNFVIYSHLTLFESPGGMSDFRAVYSRYWMLDTVMKLRALGCSSKAFPVLMGEYQMLSQKSSLETGLAAARSSTWLSVPAGVKVTALEIAGRSDDVFASTVRDLREEIFLGIQGATLQALTGGQGQQRGSSAVHKDTADLFKWHLQQAVLGCLNSRNRGLIPDLININYGDDSDPDDDYPRATMSGIDDAELGESLKIDQGLLQLGFPLSLEEVSERYSRRIATDPADIMKSPQQGQPGGAPPIGLPGMTAQDAGPEGPAQSFRGFSESSWGYRFGRFAN